MSNIFGFRTRGELVKENTELRERIVVLNERETQVDNDKREVRANHSNEISSLKTSHSIEIVGKNNEIQQLKDNFKTNLVKEVAQEKKNLKVLTDRLEKEYQDKAKRLNSEHAARIAKCDRDLENDKASYRKYFRSEHNSKVEKLETENNRLFKENVTLTAENKALNTSNGITQSQLNSVSDLNESLSETMGTLTSELVKGLAKSMPTITASFSTPEVNVNLPKTEAVKANNNNEPKKN